MFSANGLRRRFQLMKINPHTHWRILFLVKWFLSRTMKKFKNTRAEKSSEVCLPRHETSEREKVFGRHHKSESEREKSLSTCWTNICINFVTTMRKEGEEEKIFPHMLWRCDRCGKPQFSEITNLFIKLNFVRCERELSLKKLGDEFVVWLGKILTREKIRKGTQRRVKIELC